MSCNPRLYVGSGGLGFLACFREEKVQPKVSDIRLRGSSINAVLRRRRRRLLLMRRISPFRSVAGFFILLAAQLRRLGRLLTIDTTCEEAMTHSQAQEAGSVDHCQVIYVTSDRLLETSPAGYRLSVREGCFCRLMGYMSLGMSGLPSQSSSLLFLSSCRFLCRYL